MFGPCVSMVLIWEHIGEWRHFNAGTKLRILHWIAEIGNSRNLVQLRVTNRLINNNIQK